MLFHILGPLEVRGRDEVPLRLGAGKPATVLATLLLHPNAWVAGNQLIESTWQEQAVPSSAEANLKTYVWQLRRLLPACEGGPRIEGRSGAYRLHVAPGELDAQCVAEDAAAARRARAVGDHPRALALLERALGLWRGSPFERVDVEPGDTVDGLEELRRQLWECLAATQLALGRTDDAVETLRQLTTDDPLRESAWAQLVRALHELGRPAQALAAFRRAARLLAVELDVRPGPQLATAHRLLREGTAGLPGQAVTSEPSPRRELPRVPAGFSGRAIELDVLRSACVGSAPVVLVHGAGGVGKTAFVVHAAHAVSDRFPDGQFFVDLHGHGSTPPVRPAEALARLLRAIGYPSAFVPSDVDERAALWRSELTARRVLLVLDDAADAEQVEALLPASGGSAALITTRVRDQRLDAVDIGLGPLRETDGRPSPGLARKLVRQGSGYQGRVA